MICVICHYTCNACNGAGANACETCPNPLTTFRADNISVDYSCPCADYYYDGNGDVTCELCDISCLTCIGAAVN